MAVHSLTCCPAILLHLPGRWSSERIQMLEFGKAGNAFSWFLGTIRKISVLFLFFKAQEWAKQTYWGNCKQPQLHLNYTTEVSWTTTLICVLYTCQHFKAGLHYIVSYRERFLRLKWELFESGNKFRNKPQFNIQCKHGDGSFNLCKWNFHWHKLINTSISELELWFLESTMNLYLTLEILFT